MSGRCLRCCQPYESCRCIVTKGRHLCHRCCGAFKVGDEFYSDAPGIVYHALCHIAEVRESMKRPTVQHLPADDTEGGAV
jgi:hypothetical protein